jgi:hypothetical protein
MIVQVPHGHAELFGLHLNELQRPNRFFWLNPVLRISPRREKKRAKKQTCEYSPLHGLPPRLRHASVETRFARKKVSSITGIMPEASSFSL